MRYLVDSYAWIEYFDGSKKGRFLKKAIDDEKNELFTLGCCLAEIKLWTLQKNYDFLKHYPVIRANSTIVEASTADWIKAAEQKYEKAKKIPHFGLIDALLLVKQKELNCKIITGDQHFKGQKDIEFLE